MQYRAIHIKVSSYKMNIVTSVITIPLQSLRTGQVGEGLDTDARVRTSPDDESTRMAE